MVAGYGRENQGFIKQQTPKSFFRLSSTSCWCCSPSISFGRFHLSYCLLYTASPFFLPSLLGRRACSEPSIEDSDVEFVVFRKKATKTTAGGLDIHLTIAVQRVKSTGRVRTCFRCLVRELCVVAAQRGRKVFGGAVCW